MPCWDLTNMGYTKIIRLVLPLVLIFLLIYLSSTKLHAPLLQECGVDGKPCVRAQNDVIAKEDVQEKVNQSLKEDSSYEQVLEKSLKNCKGKSFQIGKMLRSFHDCVTEDNEVLLEHYLHGWRELIKFMDSMGSVFTFISHETTTKINILQGYLDSKNGKSYRTIKSMLKYEQENKVVNFEYLPSDRTPSGCRTLLRLHRALKWLEVFLYEVGTNTGQDRTSKMCADAYHETLSRYHSWFIRQVAEVAFLALPPLEEMYKIVCVQDHVEAKVVLLTSVDAIVRVYNITQDLYITNNMLDLP
ncbi:glycolipid transfer protein domain-containing protein 2 isoform X2 [Hyperolius riggenbachi]|uniref:glycolipid transfer protein domain-containing protein 2 isoform X2 n=1 Tax=Hyperolius riggenbachi TaxID=752182 RepID=UPI0035A39F33